MRKATCSAQGCVEPISAPTGKYCKLHANERALAYRTAHPEEVRASSRKWHTNHPDRSKASNRRTSLKRAYSTTPEEMSARLEEQGGKCAICGTTEPKGKGWCNDHDHKTGKLRGILCSPCNVGLGMFQDGVATLAAAIEYLKRGRVVMTDETTRTGKEPEHEIDEQVDPGGVEAQEETAEASEAEVGADSGDEGDGGDTAGSSEEN